MYCNNSNGNGASRARGFTALFAITLAMGLALMTRPAAAAPFAYVTNGDADNVSVIDTASTPPSAVATFWSPDIDGRGCNGPGGVAVTPNGKHIYVTGMVAPTAFR